MQLTFSPCSALFLPPTIWTTQLSSYPLNHPPDQVFNLSGCKCKLLSAQASPNFPTPVRNTFGQTQWSQWSDEAQVEGDKCIGNKVAGYSWLGLSNDVLPWWWYSRFSSDKVRTVSLTRRPAAASSSGTFLWDLWNIHISSGHSWHLQSRTFRYR